MRRIRLTRCSWRMRLEQHWPCRSGQDSAAAGFLDQVVIANGIGMMWPFLQLSVAFESVACGPSDVIVCKTSTVRSGAVRVGSYGSGAK